MCGPSHSRETRASVVLEHQSKIELWYATFPGRSAVTERKGFIFRLRAENPLGEIWPDAAQELMSGQRCQNHLPLAFFRPSEICCEELSGTGR